LCDDLNFPLIESVPKPEISRMILRPKIPADHESGELIEEGQGDVEEDGNKPPEGRVRIASLAACQLR
jgi:hypothetical protein